MSLVGKVSKELVGFVGVLLDPLLKPVKERPNPNASKKKKTFKILVRIFFFLGGGGALNYKLHCLNLLEIQFNLLTPLSFNLVL